MSLKLLQSHCMNNYYNFINISDNSIISVHIYIYALFYNFHQLYKHCNFLSYCVEIIDN